MKTLIKYIQAKNMEKTFEELCKDFDSCVNILSFSINVKINDELAQLKKDQKELDEVSLKIKSRHVFHLNVKLIFII